MPDYFLDKGFLSGEEVEIRARDRVEGRWKWAWRLGSPTQEVDLEHRVDLVDRVINQMELNKMSGTHNGQRLSRQ